MAGRPQGKDMTVKILACRQVYAGKNTHGDHYTIFEVDAANAQGQAINEKLRAFEALPIGQMIEVTVTPFNSERHGKSYTLHPKGGGGRSSSTEQINELREEQVRLADVVAKLAGRVSALEGFVRQGAVAAAKSPADPTAAERFGAEPPW